MTTDPIDLLIGSSAARNIIWRWWVRKRTHRPLVMVIGFESSRDELVIRIRRNSDRRTMSAVATSRRGQFRSRTWITDPIAPHDLLEDKVQNVLN